MAEKPEAPQWFTNALAGLEVGGIPLPALPTLKPYALGLGLGAS